jgi:hypothetical protein
MLYGDAVVVGEVDDEGYDQSVPAELTKLLTEPGNRQVEFKTRDFDMWLRDITTFENWYEATVYALDLDMQAEDVTDVRVVLENDR